MRSNNKRIFTNTIFLYIRLILILLVSLYTTRVVLNVLGVVDYGIYNVVAGFVSMFGFLNTSMINSIQRFYNFEKGKGNVEGVTAVYNTSIRIQIILGLITLFLLELIGMWYINNMMVLPPERLYAANWVFQFSALSLFFIIIQIPFSSACISHEKMNFYAIVGIVDAILKLVMALMIPHLSIDSLIMYGLSLLLISILNFLLYYLYAKSNFAEIRLQKGFDSDLFRKLASFSGWNIFDSLAYVVQGQGLNILINSFFNPIVNAARGIAYQIQGVIFNFSSNLAVAFKPQLVESYAKSEYDRTTSLFYSMSKASFFMQYVLSVPILLELKYILSIWLGDNIPEHTITFVQLVLLNSILNSLNMPMSQIVQATGNIRMYQFVRSCIVLLVLPLSYVFIKIYDSPEIVFIAMILITLIIQPISLILVHRVFKFRYIEYMQKVMLPSLLFAIIMPIPALYILHQFSEGIFRLFLIGFVVVISSLTLAWMVFLSTSEKRGISELILKQIRRVGN